MSALDELADWLTANGWKISHNHLRSEQNVCNWYAYRKSAIPARECECNDGKPMQVVVKPHRILHENAPLGAWESVEIEVTGEASGAWFKLMAYSLSPKEAMERMESIETSLIAAWNALLVEDKQ